MTDPTSLHDDLRYVRGVVHRAEGSKNPAIIYYLWAVISFFGYAIIDFEPEMSGFYWMIAGPGGGLLSGWLGWRQARAAGQESSRDGGVQFLYWTGMMVAILLTIPLHVLGLVSIQAVPRIILLIVAFAYFAIGIFEDRKMVWVGTILAVAYLGSIALCDFRWVWTVTACGISTALLVAGIVTSLSARRPSEKPL